MQNVIATRDGKGSVHSIIKRDQQMKYLEHTPTIQDDSVLQ